MKASMIAVGIAFTAMIGGLLGILELWDYNHPSARITQISDPTYAPMTPFAVMTFRPQIYTLKITPVPEQTRWPTMTPWGMACPCDEDFFNCRDFDDQPAAQACYDYCLSVGAGDVHRLDQNKDGRACDSY